MTQPWLLSLFLHCEASGVNSWDGKQRPLLHCPNATAAADLRAAIARGDITFHAFPHNGEASYYPDVSLYEAALDVAKEVADTYGVPARVSVGKCGGGARM